MWIQPGRGSLTGSRTRCTVHLGSFASRCITHISTDSCTSFTARASSGNGTGCSSAPRPGSQSVYSDLQRRFLVRRVQNAESFKRNRERSARDTPTHLSTSVTLTRYSGRAGNTATAATAACPRPTTRDSTPRTYEIGINISLRVTSLTRDTGYLVFHYNSGETCLWNMAATQMDTRLGSTLGCGQSLPGP